MKLPTYSSIIDPQTYNTLMTEQHIYIQQADDTICRLIENQLQEGKTEVVELGCGPARLLEQVGRISRIHLTGIDHDLNFIEYGEKILQEKKINAHILFGDVCSYRHQKPVDIFYSQGIHHHIPKGDDTKKYLRNIFKALKPGGLYILSDEFLAEYSLKNKDERCIQAILWYSLVIQNALYNGHKLLAVEETKTLLDDLSEGSDTASIKTTKQIDLVLGSVQTIHEAAQKNLAEAKKLAKDILQQIHLLAGTKPNHDPRLDLSRGDFKICDSVFRSEVEQVGFRIQNVIHIGPIQTIGGFSIYTLQKPV